MKVALVFAVLLCGAVAQRKERLLNSRYLLGWNIQTAARIVEFDTTITGTGYTGLGFNSVGAMAGADIVIGGVSSGGADYFGDYHGVGNTTPVLDNEPNYELLETRQNATHTYLRHRRYLDTGDSQDFPITNTNIYVIWSIGNTDAIEQHAERGSVQINLYA